MAQTGPLDVRIQAGGGDEATVVVAAGELDFTSIDQLRDVLLPLVEQGVVVLDTAEITFCDSVGLQVILEARHIARRNGAVFRLAAPSTQLMRVMDLAGASKVVEIFPDAESARAV
jgi:anti-anti-sigma factor